MHVETEPRMGDDENWTNGKVWKTESTEFFVSGFPSAEYQHWPLWKNWKMAAISLISIVQKHFQLPTPPKFGSPVFWVSTETEYQHWPLWKNWKMAAIPLISIIRKNFQLLSPPKFGSPVFRVLTETEYQHWPLWKNWKMAAISLISIIWKNFQLPTSQSLGLQFSECRLKQNISIGHYEKKLCQQKWNISVYWRCKFSFFWIFHWFIFPHHPS